MIKAFEDKCVMYKYNSEPDYVKFKVERSSEFKTYAISKNSKYGIFGDSIYNLQSGKVLRGLNLSFLHDEHKELRDYTVKDDELVKEPHYSFNDIEAAFSEDDKYIIICYHWYSKHGERMLLVVEDFESGEIINQIELKESGEDRYFIPSYEVTDEIKILYSSTFEEESDSFYIFSLPSLELAQKGIEDKKNGYNFERDSIDVTIYNNDVKIKTLKDAFSELFLDDRYIHYELLDNNTLLITNDFVSMLWNLNKNEMIRKWFTGNDRRNSGWCLNHTKNQMLCYTKAKLWIYDIFSGLVYFERSPSERAIVYDGFYSPDERFLIHYIEACISENGEDLGNIVYVYEHLPLNELIEKCTHYIGNRQLTKQEKTKYFIN